MGVGGRRGDIRCRNILEGTGFKPKIHACWLTLWHHCFNWGSPPGVGGGDGAPPGVSNLIWIELLSVDAEEGHEDVAHGIIVDSLPWRWLGLIKSWSDGARRCCWFAVGIVRVAITLPGQRRQCSGTGTGTGTALPVQWKETIRNWTHNNCIESGRTWNSPQANLCKWWIDRALDCSSELDNVSITFYFVNWGPRLNLLFTFNINKGREGNQKIFKWYFETLLSVGGELPWETSLVASLFMGELSVGGEWGGSKFEHTTETQFKLQLSSKEEDQGRRELCVLSSFVICLSLLLSPLTCNSVRSPQDKSVCHSMSEEDLCQVTQRRRH